MPEEFENILEVHDTLVCVCAGGKGPTLYRIVEWEVLLRNQVREARSPDMTTTTTDQSMENR